MAFSENDLVEIRNTGEGEGFSSGISYYTATVKSVLGEMGRNKYFVRYDTRLNSNGTRFMELVDSDDVRPLYPPLHLNRDFAVSARVEAYVSHAWRVGTVISKESKDGDLIYQVKLDGSGFETHCSNSQLRPHFEWNGSWFDPRRGFQRNRASTSAQGGQPANDGKQASTSAQGDQPDNQARTSPQWDQPEDDGGQAKRRRLE